MESDDVFETIDRIERKLIAERVDLAERRALCEERLRAEQRRAWVPFAALIVGLLWWAVDLAALVSGRGWQFVALNALAIAGIALWAWIGRQK